MDHWTDDAECRDHPTLPAEAWFEFGDGMPKGDGLKALMVCRYRCPVAEECAKLAPFTEAIAGGGWWDRAERFHNPGGGAHLDVYQAAAYLGISADRMQRIVYRDKLPSVAMFRGRKLYDLTTIKNVVKAPGPRHGTMAACELHSLRGEMFCDACQRVREAIRITQADGVTAA